MKNQTFITAAEIAENHRPVFLSAHFTYKSISEKVLEIFNHMKKIEICTYKQGVKLNLKKFILDTSVRQSVYNSTKEASPDRIINPQLVMYSITEHINNDKKTSIDFMHTLIY